MRILLAEDDRDLNKALTWQLTGQGYNVDTCYDGEDALYYGKQNIYDVILLDRMLPFQEGTEVLSSLRRHGVTAPVILITALGALKDKILGLDLGAAVDPEGDLYADQSTGYCDAEYCRGQSGVYADNRRERRDR